MWLQAAGALVGAGLSYFGEKDAAKKRRLAKEKAIDQIEKNMYSPGEQRTALDNIKDAYDTNIASETNSAAFGLSGVLNSNSARALMTSKLLGQRASSELQAKQQMDQYNKSMNMEIANLEAGTDTSINTGNVLMGGFAGANIGDSLDKMTTTVPEVKLTQEQLNQQASNYNTELMRKVADINDPSYGVINQMNNVNPNISTPFKMPDYTFNPNIVDPNIFKSGLDITELNPFKRKTKRKL